MDNLGAALRAQQMLYLPEYDPTPYAMRPVATLDSANSQRFTRASDSKLNFRDSGGAGVTKLSFGLWFNKATLGNQGLFCKRNHDATGTEGTFQAFWDQSSNFQRLTIGVYSASTTSVSVNLNASGGTPINYPVNTWNCLYGEFDGDGADNAAIIKVWCNSLDGAGMVLMPVENPTNTTLVPVKNFRAGTGTLQIGAHGTSSSTKFDGRLCNFFMTNGLMGGADAAAAFYNNGLPLWIKRRIPNDIDDDHVITVPVSITNFLTWPVAPIVHPPGTRYLLTAQTNAAENGIWEWRGIHASPLLIRPNDFDSWHKAKAAVVWAEVGSATVAYKITGDSRCHDLLTAAGQTGKGDLTVARISESHSTPFVIACPLDETGGDALDYGSDALHLSRANGAAAPATRLNVMEFTERSPNAYRFYAGDCRNGQPNRGVSRAEINYEGFWDPNAFGTGKGGLRGDATGAARMVSMVDDWCDFPTVSIFAMFKIITTVTTERFIFWAAADMDALIALGSPYDPNVGPNNSWCLLGYVGTTTADVGSNNHAPIWRFDGLDMRGPLTDGARLNGYGDTVEARKPNGDIRTLTGFASPPNPLADGNVALATGTNYAITFASVNNSVGNNATDGPYRIAVNAAPQDCFVNAGGGDPTGLSRGAFTNFAGRNVIGFHLNGHAIGGFLVLGPSATEAQITAISRYFNARK